MEPLGRPPRHGSDCFVTLPNITSLMLSLLVLTLSQMLPLLAPLLMLILILAEMLSASSRVEPDRLETLLPCALQMTKLGNLFSAALSIFLHNY